MIAGEGLFRVTFRRIAALTILAFVVSALLGPATDLSLFLLHRQDRWLLLSGSLLFAICSWKLPMRRAPLEGSWRIALAGTTGMALMTWAGHYWILSAYDMSRDEQMAVFDAAVFARGAFAASLPEMWGHHSDLLNTMFMYKADPRAAWISDYLPLNAAFRALIGLLATPTLSGPLMTLVGGLALWSCTRRIWPDDREPAMIGLLLYAGSAQILANGMTAYAMPGHLALNLVWLRLFLHKTWWADFMALLVGFLAVGLHQPIMHPIFAAPILSLLLLEKSWRRAAFFFGGYLTIGGFWYLWPSWMASLVQIDPSGFGGGSADYLNRLTSALERGGDLRAADMMANLLRFVAWQHLLLIPLAIAGLGAMRGERLPAALAGGIVLTITVMAIILPYQGHGFGYRYLHGLIGNFILLALFGWRSLGEALPRWRPLLIRTSLAGLVILLPVQMWMAHAFYAAPAHVSEQVDQVDADYAVISASDAPFAADLVINPPYLDKRPLRLLREAIDPEAALAICASQPSIALISASMTEPMAAYYGFGRGKADDAAEREVAQMLRRAGCKIGG
ncbi:hypothetical protein [Sphingopyxis flava]|uniref:4-amino-4-deoxy-L-arabinose transferase n=1 Tax=Sphingopyxis flava TaxID=1507287 RepID=A0A1T5BV56_9SPHN|nr:hypothetical protein [Sphingopyxis flava]SKB50969.1 hypothetical protein SAMN06295937_1007156 [Sphingopyxis flava]